MALDQLHTVEEKKKDDMTFIEHIIELRKHLVRSVIAISIGALVAFSYGDFVFDKILFGPRKADFPTFKALCSASQHFGLGSSLCIQPAQFKVITRELGETLMMQITVSFWLGLIIAFPYILYEVWRFISPGMHEHERKASRNIILICSILFFIGVLFGYFIIAPFSINFLGGYTMGDMENTPTLSSYVSYMTMFTFPLGLVFELPVLSYFLSKIGVLGPSFMRDFRRHAIVVIFIIAAIITPPDVVAQLLTALPLWVLYEVSIGVSAGVVRRKKAAEQLEAQRLLGK
jgi:sec-independent protein translocase protein TatC